MIIAWRIGKIFDVTGSHEQKGVKLYGKSDYYLIF
jgi:hypothetical protein